ncbi:hypothetical protein ACSOQT_001023 [Yersinia enterocolitica]
MSEIKQYDTEVRLEAVMGTNHYGVHIHAMTTEDLHSKSGIAVELAWRDLRIEQLIAQLEAAQKERDELKELNYHFDLSIRKVEGVSEVLRSKLEAAELELIKPLPIGELVHRLEGQTYEKWFSESDVKDLRERAEKAEAALSAANEKLSKPVVLLDKYVRNEKGQYILDGKCEPRIGFAVGWNAAIKAAGGKVEGNADAE